ncbi:malate dehydrogenase [Inmirania thermothiophila]|uniref:Malate dehydrogenase n=1 Tax=Inmirania thermothiophila TaxID=1750597 RepID=A0A3N1Y6Z4_9GAMM|nr:malate dehydrogenase [Inmirania thermothiophila]ROR34288.1 malate dehydrogenase (NAD) [Inmirania thermothiophila]
MKIAVLGAAGGIGQPLSLLLKNQLPAGSELALYDVNPVVPGVAADLSHIPTPVKVTGHGKDALGEALSGADIVVVPAGVPRKPGMTRDDLFNVNAGIVRDLARAGAEACPQVCWLIITNPVNSTVPIAAETLRQAGVYDRRKVFGVTTLDVIRANTFVAEAKGLDPRDLDVRVIGGHSGNTILPLLSQIPGVSFSDEEARALTARIQNAGTEVVEAKAGAGSATLSMAEAALRFTLAVLRGLEGEESVMCSYVQVDGMPTEFFATPVRLGRGGVEEILPYGELSALERELYEAMLPTLEANIEKGLAFARQGG